MSLFNYLQLQPVEPNEDGTVSDLDQFDQDEKIDLSRDIDEGNLSQSWEEVLNDIEQDPDKLTFHDE